MAVAKNTRGMSEISVRGKVDTSPAPEPGRFACGSLEVVLRESRGSVDHSIARFMTIDIYDRGVLTDVICISERSEAWPQGCFIVERCGHQIAEVH